MKALIDNKDLAGIQHALVSNPALANEGIPYDAINTTKAHPLHRICDGVFAGRYTDEEAVEMAKIFLQHGAHVNGNELVEKKDTPLIAAASLHADKLAFLYLENGALIDHAGCHGGTALHWAAWCGRDALVQTLAEKTSDINRLCIDYQSTPLFWAVHGLKNCGKHNQVACARILVQAGADKRIPNRDGITVFDLLAEEDTELKEILAG